MDFEQALLVVAFIALVVMAIAVCWLFRAFTDMGRAMGTTMRAMESLKQRGDVQRDMYDTLVEGHKELWKELGNAKKDMAAEIECIYNEMRTNGKGETCDAGTGAEVAGHLPVDNQGTTTSCA